MGWFRAAKDRQVTRLAGWAVAATSECPSDYARPELAPSQAGPYRSGMVEGRGALVRTLEATTHRVAVHVQEAVPDLDLDAAQVHVLSLLSATSPLTVGEIGAEFGHRRSTVTAVIDRLERRGLVVRGVNPHDRRSVIVGLSPAGDLAAGRVLAVVDEIEERAAQALGPNGRARLRDELGAILEVLGAPLMESARPPGRGEARG
jgi:DNA-binding MarR family transcriptional regulator